MTGPLKRLSAAGLGVVLLAIGLGIAASPASSATAARPAVPTPRR